VVLLATAFSDLEVMGHIYWYFLIGRYLQSRPRHRYYSQDLSPTIRFRSMYRKKND